MNSTFFSSPSRFKLGVRLLLMASACVFGPGLSTDIRAQTAPRADLTVTKSGDEAAPVGGTITYNLVVINGGPDDAVNVLLTDPLPARTTFVSASTSMGSAAFANNTLTVSFGTIPAFESGSATLVVSVNGDTPRNTTISNTATVTSDTADPVVDNNSSTAQTAVTGPFAGDLLISEFRLRGPGGPGDEFVEVYNNGDTPQAVNALDGSDGYAVAASDGVVRCTLPNGTVIPARGHFLCVNSAGYSLAAYPSGVAATAAGDATYTTDIPDNAGIALFRTANPSNFNMVTRLDAAGATSESNPLYKEGTGYPALSGVAYAGGINYSFLRDLCGKGGSTIALGTCPTLGLPKDTDNNAADFIFVDTAGTSAGAGQRLGAPGPEDLSAPPQSNGQFSLPNLDATVGASAPPNRVRDFTPVSPNTSSNGTLEIRKRVVNGTGVAVSRLRFRVIDITTFPTPSGFADLRPITSTATPVGGVNDPATCAGASTPCTVVVQGTTLEQPPSQPSGGGFNSSLSADAVTLETPLQPGESINIRFLLGVQKPGTFRFFVNIEALSFDPNEGSQDLTQTGGVVLKRPAGRVHKR
ncbi:MAG: hypothetical protein ABW250_00030 [Pyrinomonadaceae bacterium]